MKSLEELKAIRERMQGSLGIREEGEDQTRVVVGMATCGIAAGARPVLNKFAELVQERGIKNTVVTQTGCIGICRYEPIVEIYEPGKPKVTYVHMDAEKAEEIVTRHLQGGQIVNEYLIPATITPGK
ncbi:MAG: (2Fe-2S) ferredoxin domain-containing protein [Lachnospiraceae bacterium]|jgi:NADP-reducing hydrogenase subunit HndB|nr:(2Fe-2S) ferredoxin domain-containing protein [Lachnospiraceae bacterium]